MQVHSLPQGDLFDPISMFENFGYTPKKIANFFKGCLKKKNEEEDIEELINLQMKSISEKDGLRNFDVLFEEVEFSDDFIFPDKQFVDRMKYGSEICLSSDN